VESFYAGDDWKFAKNFQLSFGVRWDYQQSYSNDSSTYLKFNNFDDNVCAALWLYLGFHR
jgi:outer membrane receptor for ferrienterochelin and colicin